jgi:hypothetical protein
VISIGPVDNDRVSLRRPLGPETVISSVVQWEVSSGLSRPAVLWGGMRPTAPSPAQMDDVVVWRSLGLERMPYLASTLLALRPLDAPGLGTFAVDGSHRLYIDFEAVTSHGPVWCAEALLHEYCHVFCRPSDRGKASRATPSVLYPLFVYAPAPAAVGGGLPPYIHGGGHVQKQACRRRGIVTAGGPHDRVPSPPSE